QKPLKNIDLPFWREAIDISLPEQLILSKYLLPGEKSIGSYQITKRWNKYVKKELGITEDFYSLKHLNLDKTAALLSLEDAAALASHTSSFITEKHYRVNERARQFERLKSLQNHLL
ncbi:MAG TPA: hypothetical protein VEZ55_08620, partial [Chitinophagaceae bacterium]|nr:hypothetical protein [Chitinophagaceae bacterium]